MVELKDIDSNEIANQARASISSYCLNVCGAKCCKHGKLLLQTNEEVETISGDKLQEHLTTGILEKTPNNFMTYDLEKEPCRHLKDQVFCSIHKSDKKPVICDDYPLFLTKKYVITSKQCPAVLGGELEEYVKALEEKGFERFE